MNPRGRAFRLAQQRCVHLLKAANLENNVALTAVENAGCVDDLLRAAAKVQFSDLRIALEGTLSWDALRRSVEQRVDVAEAA
jgi:hypothetical protein